MKRLIFGCTIIICGVMMGCTSLICGQISNFDSSFYLIMCSIVVLVGLSFIGWEGYYYISYLRSSQDNDSDVEG